MSPSQSKARRGTPLLPLPHLLRLAAFISLTTSFLAACGAEDPEAAGVFIATTADVQLLPQEEACSEGLLGGACRGPWAYRAYVTPCYNEGRAAECGTESYQEPRTCLVARAGLQASFSHFVRCSGSACGSNGRATLDSKCAAHLSGHLALVAGDRSGVLGSWSLSGVAREGTAWSATCNVLLQNAGTAADPACGFETRWRYKLCRAAQFGNAPPGTCGSEAAWTTSASGLSRAQALTITPLPDPATLSCSTLEDLPVSPERQATSLQRAAAQDPYWTFLPASAEQEAQARLDLVKQAKLMFELGVASPDAIRELYDLHLQEEMSCGIPAAAPVSPSCASWGAEHGVAGALGLCRRLSSNHVPAARVAAETDRCFDLLARPALQEQSACAAEYRASAETMAEALLAKALAEIRKPVGTSQLQALDTALRRIDRWYASAKQMLSQDPAALADANGRILGAFWTRVREVGAPAPASFPTGAAGSAQAGAMLQALAEARMEVDRQVLLAAYTTPAPLGDVPLLLLTADALTPLFERLRTAASLYDLACGIQASCTIHNANQATRMVRALGALGDPEELDAAILAGGLSAPWVPVLTALRDHNDVLEAAYQLAAGRPDAELEELRQPNVVATVAGLEALVSESAAMWESYQAHGALLPLTETSLASPLSQTTRDGLLELYDDVIESFAASRGEYQAARGNAANDALAQIQNGLPQARISLELALLQNGYDEHSQDLSSLMWSQDQSELAAGRFLTRYLELASLPDWPSDYQVVPTSRTLSVSAAEARGTGAAVESAAQVAEVAIRDPDQAAQPLVISAAKGDLLTFNVSGTWTPTCGLRAMTLVRAQQTLGLTNALTATTGPEGYEISWSSAQLRARRHDSASSVNEYSSTGICSVVKASAQIPGDLPVDIGTGNASYCRSWQTGRTDEDRVMPAQRLQTSVEHAGGLRIPGTPFPTAPGGSLLAVEVVGDPSAPRVADVHVVRPHTALALRSDAQIYLVVNDKGGCSELAPQSLTVTFVRARSEAPKARALTQAMADVLLSLEGPRALHRQQGAVTAAELSALERSAYATLWASCGGCQLSSYPEQVRAMFVGWLSAEMATLERQARIAAVTRALDGVILRYAALQHDLSGAPAAARLPALQLEWELQHLAYHRISYRGMLLELTDELLLPMLRVRYPQVFPALRSSAEIELASLRTADWMLPFDELASRFQAVATEISTRAHQASIIGRQTLPLMVAFPKPGTPADRAILGAIIAPAARATGVWEVCETGWCLKRHPEFTILPEDVYGVPQNGLDCAEAAPIVKAGAFYAANLSSSTNPGWNANPRGFDIFRIKYQMFPVDEGNLGYRAEALEVAMNSRMRSLAGNHLSAWSTFSSFRPTEGNAPPTISPFGTFALELGSMATDPTTPFATAHTIVAIFEIEVRSAASSVAGVDQCRPAP